MAEQRRPNEERRSTLISVDDEAHIHAGLDAIVEWSAIGYEHIASALNGAEGLEAITRLRPDVILTDIRMPALDGLAMIARVREIPAYDPAIIVISGYDEFDYARTALRFGVEDYLLKPIDEDDLRDQLVRLRRSRARGAQTVGSTPTAGDALPAGDAPVDQVSAMGASAIRRILSGESDERVTRLAAEELGDRLFAVLLAVPSEREPAAARVPLDAEAFRDALSATKARESAAWVSRSGDTGLVTIVAPDGPNSPSAFDLWMKGLYRSLADRLDRAISLVVRNPARGGREIANEMHALVRTIGSRHVVRDHGYTVVDTENDAAGIGDRSPRAAQLRSEVDRIVDHVERADANAAVRALSEFVGTLAAHAPLVETVTDVVERLRLDIDVLVRDLDGDPALIRSRDDLRCAAVDAAWMPLPTVEAAAVAFVTEASDVISELRRSNRISVVALMRRRADRHFAEDLRIGEFATAFGMSAIYLGQLFRKSVGQGYREYVRTRRIREAQRLLTDTDLSVPDVASQVGYRDVDYFTELFKRETGRTPGAFRRDPYDPEPES